jgi:hypothetical protein
LERRTLEQVLHCDLLRRRHDLDHLPDSRYQTLTSAADRALPLGRHHHRIKTFGHWQLTCLSPGCHLWRSPHRFWFLVDQDGTHRLPDRLERSFRPADDPTHSPFEEHVAKFLLRAA